MTLPLAAAAQQPAADSSGPRRGSWAVEGELRSGADAANLLHFRSPRAAWLLGLSFNVGREHTDYDVGPGGETEGETRPYVIVGTRLGFRHYATPARRLRPLTGGGLIVNHTRYGGDFQAWSGEVYAEAGAAYFVTPQVSLGGAGEIDAGYSYQRQGGGSRTQRVGVRGTLARLLATVYF